MKFVFARRINHIQRTKPGIGIPGFVLLVWTFLFLNALHVHANNLFPDETKNNISEEAQSEENDEEEMPGGILPSPTDEGLPSIQIRIREEYVEVIPAPKEETSEELEEKRPSISILALPPWLGVLSIVLFFLLSIAVASFYLFFMTCKVYWLENGKAHFLGFLFYKRKDEMICLKMREEMLENSPAVEYRFVFPAWFVAMHRYEPVRITIGGQILEAYLEKKINHRLELGPALIRN